MTLLQMPPGSRPIWHVLVTSGRSLVLGIPLPVLCARQSEEEEDDAVSSLATFWGAEWQNAQGARPFACPMCLVRPSSSSCMGKRPGLGGRVAAAEVNCVSPPHPL